MASIAPNPFFSGGTSSAGATAGSTAGNAPVGGTSAEGAAADPTSTFMQLVTGMIHGNTQAEQLPPNLAAFLLTGDAGSLEALESGDLDGTDPDDEDTEDAEALALAALLPGLHSSPNAPAGNAHGRGHEGPTLNVVAGQHHAMQTTLDTTQAALMSALEAGANESAATEAGAEAVSSAGQPGSASPVQAMLLAHRAAEAAPQSAPTEVRTPVGARGWSDEIGTHLTMMAANGREAASLRLSPEHLGPLEIRISMKDGEANVFFGATNADTRSALEQSIPRLREMFASQGLVLGDANVSRDAPRDNFKPSTFAQAPRGSSDADAESAVRTVTLARKGLVDTYV